MVFRIRHEVRREIALVELHAFDEVERRLDALGFFDRDRAVLADLVHRVGDDLADRRIPVGGNGGDLGDLRAVLDLLADLCELGDDRFDGLADAALKTVGFAPAVTFFRPSRKIASARTVAVVVPSPAMSLVLLATS